MILSFISKTLHGNVKTKKTKTKVKTKNYN